jgi:hypothetical protein
VWEGGKSANSHVSSFALGAFAFVRALFSSRFRALFCFALTSTKKAPAPTSEKMYFHNPEYLVLVGTRQF